MTTSATKYSYLIDICNSYEISILSKYGSLKDFYYKAYIDHEYENVKKQIISDLKFIGSGKCCEVYSHDDFDYVVKLHTPYSEKIDLRSNPSKQVQEISKLETEASEKTNWADPKSLKYFLCYEYITINGLAGVQKKADCSIEAQKKAYTKFGQIDPYLQQCNTVDNMGILNNDPVFIDWF